MGKQIELIKGVRDLIRKHYEGDESAGVQILFGGLTDLLLEDDALHIASSLLEDVINSKADLEIQKLRKILKNGDRYCPYDGEKLIQWMRGTNLDRFRCEKCKRQYAYRKTKKWFTEVSEEIKKKLEEGSL